MDAQRMSESSENPKVPRRLAAILAADIAGYSALMGADEANTVRNLKEHQAVVLPMIKEHGGRVIDTAGDGILATHSRLPLTQDPLGLLRARRRPPARIGLQAPCPSATAW
jgi:class 3 adenylate cyclase